jgi:alpha-mannosidase
MKRFLVICYCWAVLPAAAQQPAYFIDGYHGGIYGHLPSWQTRFMVDKLREYPDWKINLELEPESWDSIALSDPGAYGEFQQLFADQSSKGRIEYVNPSYGQSYLFNVSGESMIRQFYYGIRTLRRHFPTAVFTTYSSEEPCYTSALPQVLRSYGFRYASLKNPNTCWGGYTRAFGGELVNWIGPDGTSILTSPRYAVEALKPRSIWETIASSNSTVYIQAAFAAGIQHPVGMCLQDAGWNYGPWLRGDHYTPTVYETWRGYFDGIADKQRVRDWRFSQEDVLVGLMWGAQVLQRIAREVRLSENTIIQAEKMAAMAAVWKGAAWPGALLDEGWRTLLLSEHHDCWIVPYNGKPGNTWADKVVQWTGVTNKNSEAIIGESANLLAGGAVARAGRMPGGASRPFIRVYNTTSVTREEYVHVGNALYKVKVPPMGYTTCRAADSVSTATDVPRVTRSGSNWEIETDLYRMVIDTTRGGAITSWIARKLGNKEFVRKDSGLNVLRGNFYNNGGMRSSMEKPAEIHVFKDGPEVRIQIKGIIVTDTFSQVLTLRMGQPRVDVRLRIDWKDNPAIGEYFDTPKDNEVRKAYYDDRYKLLALFPLQLDSQKVYKNAPFDVTTSGLDNTFYNRWDSIKNNVLLNWVDVTDGSGDYGMALFSDHTTSYAHGGDFPLGLTLQYSGNGIFYRNYTLNGPLELSYALLPHAGRWDKAGIWTEGTKWNEPLIVCPATDSGTRSLVMPDKGVEVSSMHVEGGELDVRLFNASAAGPTIRLYLGFGATTAEEVELDGRLIKALPVRKDKSGRRWVSLGLPRFGIKTIKFNHV